LLFDLNEQIPAREGEFTTNRKKLLDATNSAIEKHGVAKRYHTILLDESQDYLVSEIELFKRLSTNLFAVADSRQKIYNGDSPLDFLEKSSDHVIELKHHYRNGTHICRVADSIGGGFSDYNALLPNSNYDETKYPSQVEIEISDGLDELISQLVAKLQRQLKAYPSSLIGVVCPRSEDLVNIWDRLEKSSVSDSCLRQDSIDGYSAFDRDRPIIVCSIHSAKGLEFRVVNLVVAEGIKNFRQQRTLSYVAVTRTKTSLNVFHCKSLAGYFEEALVRAGPEPAPPDLDDVFKGGP